MGFIMDGLDAEEDKAVRGDFQIVHRRLCVKDVDGGLYENSRRGVVDLDVMELSVEVQDDRAAFVGGVILRSGGPLWLILAGGRRETSHSVRGLLGRPKGSFRHTITHLQLH